MKTGELKRQGDVALEKVSAIPASAKKRDGKVHLSKVIARGETSNHSHAVIGEEIEVFEEGSNIYVDAKGKFKLSHVLETEFLKGNEVWTKEHTDLEFEPGQYKFIGQTEYHPYEDEIRRVKD
jgi:hypothetical protein